MTVSCALSEADAPSAQSTIKTKEAISLGSTARWIRG
jgi:hypothetical protein